MQLLSLPLIPASGTQSFIYARLTRPIILCQQRYLRKNMKNTFENSCRLNHANHGGKDACHDDVIKWKHFPRYWHFVWGIHRSTVKSPQKGQWRRALMFSLICAWINGWVNNREAVDLRRHRAHCDVTVIFPLKDCFIGLGDSLDRICYQTIA